MLASAPPVSAASRPAAAVLQPPPIVASPATERFAGPPPEVPAPTSSSWVAPSEPSQPPIPEHAAAIAGAAESVDVEEPPAEAARSERSYPTPAPRPPANPRQSGAIRSRRQGPSVATTATLVAVSAAAVVTAGIFVVPMGLRSLGFWGPTQVTASAQQPGVSTPPVMSASMDIELPPAAAPPPRPAAATAKRTTARATARPAPPSKPVAAPAAVGAASDRGTAAPARATAPPANPAAAPRAGAVEAPTGRFFEPTDVDEAPRIATRVEPRLPADLKHQKVNDVVIVRILVSQSGHPARVNVLRRSKLGSLTDDAVIAAVSKWTFSPARKKGQAVSSWYNVGVPLSSNN